ncbi:MAG: ABC transporter permease [Deltaproteobacteria bacterium]|nr:ABC transporter permease [Deltaproteobacteria bacterium]
MTRFAAIVRLSTKQKMRDLFALSLSMLTAPLFVLFYWVLFHDSHRNYQILLLDESADAVVNAPHLAPIRQAFLNMAQKQGGYTFSFETAQRLADVENALKRREADLAMVFATPLVNATKSTGAAARVELVGDVSSVGFQFCANAAEKIVSGYVAKQLRQYPPLTFDTRALGISANKTPFEAYVPGLLVFAVIMLIFSSAMSVVKEIEGGTFARLRMTPVHIAEMVGGFSLVQLVVGILSVVITFGAAYALGFKSEGALWLAMLTAAVACMASVGIGMVVAALSKTQGRAFLLASIVMFLLVLFSGIIFPRPTLELFTVGATAVDLFDVLPTTHMGSALDKILTLGASFADVQFELGILTLIGIINFIVGSLLFVRSGKPAATTWEGML